MSQVYPGQAPNQDQPTEPLPQKPHSPQSLKHLPPINLRKSPELLKEASATVDHTITHKDPLGPKNEMQSEQEQISAKPFEQSVIPIASADQHERLNDVSVSINSSIKQGNKAKEDRDTPAAPERRLVESAKQESVTIGGDGSSRKLMHKKTLEPKKLALLKCFQFPDIQVIKRLAKTWSKALPITDIILNYSSLVTQCLTLYAFWSLKQYYYFGFMLGFLCLASALTGYLLIRKFGTHKGLFLWISHLDLIYLEWLIAEDNGKDIKKLKKEGQWITLFAQTIPCLFITVHSIFLEHTSVVITHVSLLIGIINVSRTNITYLAGVVDEQDRNGTPVLLFCWIILENFGKVICWGFFAYFTRPWGIWTLTGSIAGFYLIINLLKTDEDKRSVEFWKNLLMNMFNSMFIGRIELFREYGEATWLFYNTTCLKVLEVILYAIILGVYHSTLKILIHEGIWLAYLIVAVVSIFFYLIVSPFIMIYTIMYEDG